MSDEMKVFDWDDEILDDGEERSFIVLEEGDYEFTVSKFEKAFFTAKADSKIPSCPEADITLKISTPDGDAYVKDRFFLVGSTEWRISAFFRSIGLKKRGEKLRMRWNDAIDCTGKAHITKTAGTKEDTYFNNVKYYIDPEAKPADQADQAATEEGSAW